MSTMTQKTFELTPEDQARINAAYAKQDADRRAKLEAFALEQLRHEVGVLHGVIPFGHGYKQVNQGRGEDHLYAKEIEPGIWIKLLFCEGYAPGWSWYISDKPDQTYVDRGGACIADEARIEAEEHFAENRQRLVDYLKIRPSDAPPSAAG